MENNYTENNYRFLVEGDIIQSGDEQLINELDNHWAPVPKYLIGYRMLYATFYRRPIKETK